MKCPKCGSERHLVSLDGNTYCGDCNAVWKTIQEQPEDRTGEKMSICICCGAEIPEGRQVCPNCERKKLKEPRTRLLLYSCLSEHEMRVQAEDKIKKLYELIEEENNINILRERAREEI